MNLCGQRLGSRDRVAQARVRGLSAHPTSALSSPPLSMPAKSREEGCGPRRAADDAGDGRRPPRSTQEVGATAAGLAS